MEPSNRRSQILDAALACFVSSGIDGATIADIRKRAGATTGSVYHFFESKDAIVGALYLEVLRDYHEDLVASLRTHTSARALVRGVVEQYLAWVERRPDAARFLIDARRTAAIATVEHQIGALNVAAFKELDDRITRWSRQGEIRTLPMELYFALLIGPAEAFTRAWLAGKATTTIDQARTVLARAAWDSIRKEPGA